MNGALAASNIQQIKNIISKSKVLKDKKRDKYIADLDILHGKYLNVSIEENFNVQYKQMNKKGVDLLKELKGLSESKDIERSIEVYIRYLKASIGDFEGRTIIIKKYITSFIFTGMLFLALTPQFYGFILPMLFFIPIYIGLKGVKNRSITGFYMTMSVVPVGIMTGVTWVRYGLSVMSDYDKALNEVVTSGISESLARILIVVEPILGGLLVIFALTQLYRGIKSRDLFV